MTCPRQGFKIENDPESNVRFWQFPSNKGKSSLKVPSAGTVIQLFHILKE